MANESTCHMTRGKQLIYLEDLLKYPIRINHYDMVNGNRHFVLGGESVLEYAENLPTVDAVPVVHGHWEYGKWEKGHWVKGNERCRCSVCHRDFAVDNLNIWHGCPQCLAKMDGGDR